MGGGFRVLHLVRPFLSFLPEVQTADRKIPFREKVGYIHSHLSLYLSRLQSASSLWNTFHYGCRSILLDACDSRIKQGYCYGAWHYSNCYLWTSDAALGRFKNHWSRQQCAGGPCIIVSFLIVANLPFFNHLSIYFKLWVNIFVTIFFLFFAQIYWFIIR